MDNGLMGYMGTGMVSDAATALTMRDYQLYVQECKALGQVPLPYPQWQAQQKGTPPTPQPQPQQVGMSQQQFNNGPQPTNRAQLLSLLAQRAQGMGQ